MNTPKKIDKDWCHNQFSWQSEGFVNPRPWVQIPLMACNSQIML